MKQNNRKSSGRPASAMGSESGQSQRGRGGGRYLFKYTKHKSVLPVTIEDAVEVAAGVAVAVVVDKEAGDGPTLLRPIVKVCFVFKYNAA